MNHCIFLTFSYYSFHNHLSQAFTLYQSFAALGGHKQRTVKLFNYLAIIDHEANMNFRAICYCYTTTQIKLLLWCKNFFCGSHVRLAEALLCKIVQTIHQDLTGSCSCELSRPTISFDFILSSVGRKDFSWCTWIINSVYESDVACGICSGHVRATT